MRLLIAEDDRMTADTLGKRLRGEHYAVDVCYDGLEAWDCLRSAAYDVAVLDIMWPGWHGAGEADARGGHAHARAVADGA